MPRCRLDQRLVALGLAESREQARRLIMAGEVAVDGQTVDWPGAGVPEEASIALKARPRFVSRGGDKLEAALTEFAVDVRSLICADVGAATGGFTDCLLQRGAARVYAIDVGRGILHWRLRSDPRVVVLEETNARYLESLPEPPQFITVDVSFISLKLLLPVIRRWAAGAAGDRPEAVILIKPQFEAGRRPVSRGSGVIRDAEIWRRVLLDVLGFAETAGWTVRGLIASPVRGPKGNVEFLAWLGGFGEKFELPQIVEQMLQSVVV